MGHKWQTRRDADGPRGRSVSSGRVSSPARDVGEWAGVWVNCSLRAKVGWKEPTAGRYTRAAILDRPLGAWRAFRIGDCFHDPGRGFKPENPQPENPLPENPRKREPFAIPENLQSVYPVA